MFYNSRISVRQTLRGGLICVLLLFGILVVSGQSVRVFTADEGLSCTLLNDVCVDRDGIIWIATENGLNRYDGVKLTVYKNRPGDEHSLAHNYVRTLFTDRDGRFFVGTYNGVQLYDPASDTFSAPARFKDNSTLKNYITGIIQRRSGEIWVSGNVMCRLEITDEGLYYDRLELSAPTSFIETMMADGEDNIWFSKEGYGVYRLGADGHIKSFPISKDLPFIIKLCTDKEGNVYGGSPRNGAYRYDRKTDKFIPLAGGGSRDFPVKTIFPAGGDAIYIGTDGNGMKVYDGKTRRLTDYIFEDDSFATSNLKVHAVCRDNTGNLWIGIYQKGVLMIPPRRSGFRYWGSKSVSKDFIGDCCVTAVYCDAKGTTYVGTDNDGLYVISKDCAVRRHYMHTGDPSSVPAIIVSVFEDSRGRIWLGSYADGAAWFDPATGRCTHIEELRDEGGKQARNIYGFAEDKRGRVWIATMGNGLYSYDPSARRITHYPDTDNWIGCIYYSQAKNRLYLGTYNGMCVVNPDSPADEPRFVLHQSIVYSFCEGHDGHIWAGTSEGLLGWDAKTDSLEHYTADDGLCNNMVYAVREGDDGYLWISTSNGMSRFQPATKKFINYYAGDGLQGNEFSKNASFRDSEGRLWFGGVNGITWFNPLEITTATRKRQVRITDFYLFGKPVRKGVKSGGKDIIDCPVYNAETFRLAHNDNAFTIEFSTVELDNTDRIIYEYSMNDDRWIALPHGINRISFSGLSPGRYRFRVRASDGMTVCAAKEIVIRIDRPWWSAWWAWVVYIILILAAAVFITGQIRRRLSDRRERLRLLRAEQLGEAKLQFFINISHEIRTPMTLIISPLRQLMERDGDEKRQRAYGTIYRNAERILNLVNQLMDIRKIDKGQMRLRFKEVNIVSVLSDIYAAFSDIAEEKHISYTFRNNASDPLPLWIDPAHFDKIIVNILSNAFKFTPDGGSIEVALRRADYPLTDEPLRSVAEITVTDSGTGIDALELERIFDRFYQTENNTGHNGTGVGLHLTRSLVRLHHGVVFAENLPEGQSGCRFTVRLPLGCGHLREDEIEKEGSADAPENKETGTNPNTPPVLTPLSKDGTAGASRTHRRILIAEDDDDIRLYLKQELEDMYVIEECVNGKEALESVFLHVPDLIISDVMMPEMDGLELCRRIRQNIRLNHIPIILLTAKAGEEDNIEGLDTGADAYITKPFNLEVLRHTIKNLLSSRALLRTIYSGRQRSGEEKLEKITAQSPDDRLMERIMKTVNAHLADPDLTVETIASEVGISRVHLHRKLKELTNQTTRNFLKNIRMKQAATLLAEKKHSISEVAGLVGYSNLSTFSTCFKSLYGVSPSAYGERAADKKTQPTLFSDAEESAPENSNNAD
ncbi:MAG: response regulator [Prevotella sp.]|nr:response regulator [Prevotella sp.]